MVKGFYRCPVCGKVAQVAFEGPGKMACCDKPMDELKANATDASQEKHVPQVEVNGDHVTVCVGSVSHPMTEAHLINWIYLDTDKGGQYHYLAADEAPKAEFVVPAGEKPLAVYAYCNLHGLWVKEL